MTRRGWTVLLIPHDTTKSRHLGISAHLATFAAAFGIILAAGTLAATTGLLSRSLHLARSAQLTRSNGALADTIERLGGRVHALTDSLAALSQRDDALRLLAGLDSLSPDVRLAGIGGPAGAWPQRDQLLAAGDLGHRALAVRLDLDALVRQANVLAVSSEEAAESLAAHSRELAATPSIMPTPGYISSHFMAIRYHPILHENLPHEGIDIAAAYGTRILAAAAGRVSQAGWDGGYGLAVMIDHGYGLQTRYGHMSRIAVSVGQQVRRGDLLGYVGSTGLSTGPHLHYEVRVHGRAVDPLKFVVKDGYSD